MKRFLFLILTLTVLVTSSMNFVYANGIENIIEKTTEYSNGYFTDISENDWFYKYVISSYEYGIISGNGDGIFNPHGNTTIAEAIIIASRINQKTVNISREIIQNSNDVWYMPYINYAESTGIISKGKFFGRYETPATRAEFIYIICNCLGKKELTNENPYINSIHDMKKEDNYYDSVLKAIKAGIITGKNTQGDFCPDDYITRAEVSTILTRILEKNQRKSQVRELTSDWESDKYDYYIENQTIRNYAKLNNIHRIWRGYYIGTQDAVYMYLYNEDQLNLFIKTLESDGYNVLKEREIKSILTEYSCTKKNSMNTNVISITVFHGYSQVWISFPMDIEYYKENFVISEEITTDIPSNDSIAPWNSSKTFLESDYVLNYGNLNNIECKSREVFYDNNGITKVRYKYDFIPSHFIVYCEFLDSTRKLDTLSVDSNALFLNFTYYSRNSSVRIFVDLIENTVSIEFEKTNATDL